jgi:hypothetical protein
MNNKKQEKDKSFLENEFFSNRLSKFPFNERFKIMEYMDFSIILPVDGKYDLCLFFFAGFNENSSKYVYLFKHFFELLNFEIKIKIVIPTLPKYEVGLEKGQYPTHFMKKPKKFKQVYAWFSYSLDNGIMNHIFNTEKDNFVVKLIRKEIKILGSEDKLIFSAFSMGGGYLLHMLELTMIKTRFNFIIKSPVGRFGNLFKNLTREEEEKINSNFFHLILSYGDKVVPFEYAIQNYREFKKKFTNVTLKVDNGKRHVVDYNSLALFEDLIRKHCKEEVKFSPSLPKF